MATRLTERLAFEALFLTRRDALVSREPGSRERLRHLLATGVGTIKSCIELLVDRFFLRRRCPVPAGARRKEVAGLHVGRYAAVVLDVAIGFIGHANLLVRIGRHSC